MPYARNRDLPAAVRNVLPNEAQTIFRRVFNSQEANDLSEDRAFASAWGALRNQGWAKGDDGKWHKTEKSSVETPTVEIIKSADDDRYTLGIVYAPNTVDLQDEFATGATIVAAQREFMRRIQGDAALTKNAMVLVQAAIDAIEKREPIRLKVGDIEALAKSRGFLGDEHSDWDPSYGTIVECYCTPGELTLKDRVLVPDTWLLGTVWSPQYYQRIKSGERRGYSLGGTARRRWLSQEEWDARYAVGTP